MTNEEIADRILQLATEKQLAAAPSTFIKTDDDLRRDRAQCVREAIIEVLATAHPAPGEVVKAIEKARSVLISSMAGSCTCNTKTPEVKFHAFGCMYRDKMDAVNSLDILERLKNYVPGENDDQVADRIAEAIAEIERLRSLTGEKIETQKVS